jgi:hypothetical protein
MAHALYGSAPLGLCVKGMARPGRTVPTPDDKGDGPTSDFPYSTILIRSIVRS